MRILYLHQYFVPPDGSGGTRSYEMARRLVRAGHKVVLITSNSSFPSNYFLKKSRDILEMDGIELRVLNVPYSNKMSFVRRIFAFFQFVVMASFESLCIPDVDVVFATSTPLTIAIPGLIAKLRHRCRMVFEVRDLWPELPIAIGALNNPLVQRLALCLEKLAYKNAFHLVALSPGMAIGVAKAGVDSKNITVIPNSCDVEMFSGKDWEGKAFLDAHPYLFGSKLIVYTGTFGLINGVGYLVYVAKAMQKIDPDIRFFLCGNGKERAMVERLALDHGVLDKNLWFSDSLPKSSMPDLLAAADIATSLVINLPELWHNSANKYFDALASGTPVMINYGGWQAEFIHKTGCGLVVSPTDTEQAAGELKAFLDDPIRMRNASMAASTAAYQVYNRDLLAEKLRRVLEDAVDDK